MGETAEYVLQLSEAVNAAMDPAVAQQKRMEAYELCEKFKETSPHCVACGVEMSNVKYPPVIRHFGLQLLEHCARFRWNNMGGQEKVIFKDTIIELLKNGTLSLVEEQAYIKDGLSRIVVEMIKREWPQQWPTLLAELDQLCQCGELQTELVLFILLRLVEDVVAFQNLPSQRRRDLLQALTANMGEIMKFLLQLLQQHTERYKQFLQSSQEQQAALSCRVAQAVLLTLSGYVDWVNCQHVFAEDLALLKMLYNLLGDSNLKLLAAECLHLIVTRKGKVEDRRPLLVLFSEDAMCTILNAARLACSVGVDEENYIFLKKLCQVLTGLGVQLCALYSPDLKDFSRPPNFKSYLEALLSFTQHPSIHVSNMTMATYLAFLRHEHISEDPVLKEIIPQILKLFTEKLQRVGFPSRDDSPSCEYSRLDFDSDDEFNYFFSAVHRAQQMDLIRLATQVYTEETFQVACEWFNHVIVTPLQWEQGKDKCTPYSPSYLQWDALSCFMDSTMWGLFKVENPPPIPVQGIIKLLKEILCLQIEDPCILSFVLTCVSASHPIIKYAPELLDPMLDKLFSAAVFSLPGQTKTRTRPVQNLRRHACSALVRMCKDHPDLMMPAFEKIYAQIRRLSADPDQLTQLERVTLNEALILISNKFKNFVRQSALIGEILQPVRELWTADNFKEAISCAESFVGYIGLNHVLLEDNESMGSNRVVLLFCITSITASLKRAEWPNDPKEAEAGGFISSHLANGNPIYKNPSLPHVLPLLENVLIITRTFNNMWSPEIRNAIPAENNKVYDMQEVDKNQILGITIASPAPEPFDVQASKSQAEKIQGFLVAIHDNCYHILASCCQSLGHEFYAIPGLAAQLISSVFVNLQYLPEFRLRPIIRVFMKALVHYCPVEHYNSVLVPILSELCSYMFGRLSSSWETLNKRAETSDLSQEDQETQEILEEQLIRLVTREYLDLLSAVCKKRYVPSASKDEGAALSAVNVNEAMGDGEVVMAEAGGSKKPEGEELSELGRCILQNESLCQSIVVCVYTAMSWMDSATCLKAANLCQPLFNHLYNSSGLSCEAAKVLYTAILRGLELHGQHDAIQSALVIKGLHHYEILRPHYQDLAQIMLQIPNCDKKSLDQFDEKFILHVDPNKPMSEKKRREAYKKLVAGVVGKHIGQEFRREVHIRDLPPIIKLSKPKPSVLDDEPRDTGLADLFSTS
ncbi:exportin-5-like isoform X2 [Amphiura filiformis]|uniref:exportin-5-like isoform X2 n=1 Tax=Amphiura filiformis TaxID=82378 RepID=UPI003B220366